MDKYIASLAHSAEHLGPDLLKMVPSPYGGTVARLMIEMGGESNLHKRRVISVTIFNWIANKPVERGDAEFHQPDTC